MSFKPNIYYVAGSSPAATARAQTAVDVMRQFGEVMNYHRLGEAQTYIERRKNHLDLLVDCDMLIADVTNDSTAAGFALGVALTQLHIPALTLHSASRQANAISSLQHPLHTSSAYETLEEFAQKISDFCQAMKPRYVVHPKLVMWDAIDGAGKGVPNAAYKEWAADSGFPIFDAVAFASTPIVADGRVAYRNPTIADVPAGTQVVFVAEPTYAGVGSFIRNVLIKSGSAHSVQAIAEAYAMDRYELYEDLVLPALERGMWVFSDRGVVTSDTYQAAQSLDHGYDEQLFRCTIRGLSGNRRELENLPGLLILLQVPPEVAQQRLDAREKQDSAIFENITFQTRTAKRYASTELKDFFERRGTNVCYLDTARGTPADAKDAALRIFEEYRKK